MRIPYATVEDTAEGLEVSYSAYATNFILGRLCAAATSLEGFLHRRFYPERRTVKYDWPNYSMAPTWEIELGINEMISKEQVLSGGTDITDDVFLRRGDGLEEPPYSLLQVDLSSNAAFMSGTTFQQAIHVLGLYGENDTDTSLANGTLNGAITTTTETSISINPASDKPVGTGALIKIDDEWLLTVARRMNAVSGQTITADVASSKATVAVGVTSGAAFVPGETILIDGERMLINDIAGNTLLVSRSWDGTPLAAHTSGAAIYALRTYIVQRGMSGSTAATHLTATNVHAHNFPPLVTELNIAEAHVLMEQNKAAWARSGGAVSPLLTEFRSQRVSAGIGLDDIRERAYIAHGRKLRSGAV